MTSRRFSLKKLTLAFACSAAVLLEANTLFAIPNWAQSYGTGSYDSAGAISYDGGYGSGWDNPVAIAKMPDGGFVVAGQLDMPRLHRDTYNDHTGSVADAALVRFATDGSIAWQVTLHETIGFYSGPYFQPFPTRVVDVQTDAQGNVFILGGKSNPTAGGQTPFVAKFSPDGELIWQNGITGANEVSADDPPQTYQTSIGGPDKMSLTNDGGVVLMTAARYLFNGGYVGGYKPVFVKFDGNGAVSLFRPYNIPDYYATTGPICQTAEGSKYVEVIRHTIDQNGTPGIIVAVVNANNGAMLSQNGYATPAGGSEYPIALVRTSDGNLAMLSGTDDRYKFIVRKFSSDGSAEVFEKTISAPYPTPFWPGNLVATSDGGVLVGGHSGTVGSGSGEDAALAKITSSGVLEFVSVIGGPGYESGLGGPDNVSLATTTADGGYAIVAPSSSFYTGVTPAKPDWWTAKMKADRKVATFNGFMADRDISYYSVLGSPQAPVPVSYYSAPGFSFTPVVSDQPTFLVQDLAAFTPPDLPTVQIQVGSPRILSARKADAYVTRHFAYHILCGFFPAGATLTYNATNLPQGFVIDHQTGVISGVPGAGSETTTPIQIGLSVTDGANTALATLGLTVSDGAPTFTVNGSDQPLPTSVADKVLTFVARQPGKPASRALTVEYSTTPDQPNSWTHLTNATNGFMPFDSFGNAYVLGTLNYPHVAGIYFRARSTTPDRADGISNVIGPFDLSSNAQRLGKTSLFVTHNGPVANIRFGVTEETVPSGISVRIQATQTPASEGSWIDVPNGTLTQDNNTPAPNQFYLGFDTYSENTGVFFRAVASAAGYVDSVSAMNGPFTFINDPAPQVTLSIPGVSGSDGQDFDFPITPQTQTFDVSANAQSSRQIKKLSLIYDGDILQQFGGQQGTTQYNTNVAGDHIIEAVAADDLNVLGDARPVHVRIAPEGGKIYYLTTSGNWSDSSIWIDGSGNHGVPAENDFAVLGDANVTLTGSVQVRAVSMNGATIGYTGTARPKLTVMGWCTVGGGKILTDVDIADGATLLLINDRDLGLGGLVTNLGRIKFHGKGGITGVNTSSGTTARLAQNGGQNPDGLFDFVGELVNKTIAFFSRPAGGRQGSTPPPPPAPADPPAPEVRTIEVAQVENSGKLIGNDGSSLIGNDGASIASTGSANAIAKTASGLVDAHGNPLVAAGGGNLVAAGGGNLVAAGGGNIVSAGGGNLVAAGGGNIVSQGAGNIIGNDGASVVLIGGSNMIGNDGASFKPGGLAGGTAPRTDTAAAPAFFTQTAGELAMNHNISILDSVELDGGIMSGSGLITGDLANNAGFITPGHSAGTVGVAGSFMQGPNGSLLITASGGEASQFDQVHVGGNANLNGQLRIYTFKNYVPLSNDPFAPLAYNGVSGSFAIVTSNAQVTVTNNGVVSALPPQSEPPPVLQVSAIKSRKAHGDAGTFDVNLGLDGGGVEPRSGGAAGNFTVVFTLTNPITSIGGVSVASGTGSVVSAGIGANAQEFAVQVTGVLNTQSLTLSLSNLRDTFDQTTSSAAGTLNVLLGDANGDSVVNSGDATIVRNRSGNVTDSTNFRADVNADGVINSADATIVRARSGSSLGASRAPATPVRAQ